MHMHDKRRTKTETAPRRQRYVPPRWSMDTGVDLQCAILQGSLSKNFNENGGPSSSSQDLEQTNADDVSFNHEWN